MESYHGESSGESSSEEEEEVEDEAKDEAAGLETIFSGQDLLSLGGEGGEEGTDSFVEMDDMHHEVRMGELTVTAASEAEGLASAPESPGKGSVAEASSRKSVDKRRSVDRSRGNSRKSSLDGGRRKSMDKDKTAVDRAALGMGVIARGYCERALDRC
jgi:hypothetical protein